MRRGRQRRFVVAFGVELSLGLTLCLTLCLGAAAAATPCSMPGLPDTLSAIDTQLKRANTPDQWREIAQQGLAASGEGPANARACAHYLAGSAHFFLSAARPSRVRHAMLAARHFASAQGLAPDQMKDRQPTSRLRTAWARIGKVEGWLSGSKRVRVEVPAAEGTVVLRPPPVVWDTACGDAPACAQSAFEAGPGGSIDLRPGRYRVTHTTKCGEASVIAEVRAGPLRVPPPAPCPVALTVRDGEAPIAGFALADPAGKPLSAALPGSIVVSAPGYLPKAVEVQPGAALAVTLDRCVARLDIKTDPPTDQIEGAGPGPWGARELIVRRAGYAELRQTVDVGMGACETPQSVELNLARPVTVSAMGPDGEALTLTRLDVGGVRAEPAGFSKPPGIYFFSAAHPQFGKREGELTIRHCSAPPCPPAQLTVQYGTARPPKKRGNGPLITMGIGAALLAGGTIAGVSAWSVDQDVDGYTNKADKGVALDDLVEERNQLAETADAFLVTGGLTLVAGLIWHWVRD